MGTINNNTVGHDRSIARKTMKVGELRKGVLNPTRDINPTEA